MRKDLNLKIDSQGQTNTTSVSKIKFSQCGFVKGEEDKKVAVIGAGPAGLSAAANLRCAGYRVDIFDKMPEPGGMLVFAIPEFRLPKKSVFESIRDVEKMGVGFFLETEVGRNLRLAELLEDYDAVLVSTGTWRDKKLNIRGEDKRNVFYALSWIHTYMSYLLGYSNRAPAELRGKVGIIGAGLTAVDIAELAALEYNAEPVILYRRPKTLAPARHLVKHLESLGVTFIENVEPIEIIGESNIGGIRLARVKPTTSRSEKTEIIPGTEFELELDTLVIAIGMEPTPPPCLRQIGVELNHDGSVKISENYMTTLSGLFAAGDVAHGPSNIGLAIRSGRIAAQKIAEWLRRNS